MKIGIDWNETSTIRGLIWGVGGLISLLLLVLNTQEKALTAISITASIVGGVGVAVKDK